MANVGGFLQALGGFFQGYGQDQQNRASAALTAQKLAMDRALNNAQMAHLTAETDALQHPKPAGPKIMAGPGGQLVDVTDPMNPRPIGPAPVAPSHRSVLADRGVIIDEDTGKATPIQGLPAKPQEPKAPVPGTPAYYAMLEQQEQIKQKYATPQGPKPTDFSNKAALVYPRAEQAAHVLDPYFANGAPKRAVLGHVPLIGNYMVGDDAQQLNQAAETVASAILRVESGAAISESEVKSYARQFLPEPGDSPEVRAQKRATLQTQLERLKYAASPSMPAAERGAQASVPPASDTPRPANVGGAPSRLTPAQVARAARDPEYKAFLIATGKLPGGR